MLPELWGCLFLYVPMWEKTGTTGRLGMLTQQTMTPDFPFPKVLNTRNLYCHREKELSPAMTQLACQRLAESHALAEWELGQLEPAPGKLRQGRNPSGPGKQTPECHTHTKSLRPIAQVPAHKSGLPIPSADSGQTRDARR